MKISVSDVKSNLVIRIEGYEPWLDRIYSMFPVPEGCEKPLIAGIIELEQEGGSEIIKVQGRLDYSPFVKCSRCAEDIPWPLYLSFRASFKKAPDHLTGKKILDLKTEELDEYYMDADGTIDLESLVNDQIQTNIPLQTVPLGPDGKSCSICGLAFHDDKVFEDNVTQRDGENPFAELKKLVLDA